MPSKDYIVYVVAEAAFSVLLMITDAINNSMPSLFSNFTSHIWWACWVVWQIFRQISQGVITGRNFVHRISGYQGYQPDIKDISRISEDISRIARISAGYQGYQPDITRISRISAGYQRLSAGYQRISAGYQRISAGYQKFKRSDFFGCK